MKKSKETTDMTLSKDFRKRLAEAELITSGWFSNVKNPNGTNRKLTLKEVWHAYRRDHLPTITESSRTQKIYRCYRFLPPLFGLLMYQINPQILSEFVRFSKERAAKKLKKQRFNFERELRDLRSIFNWYKSTIDFQFVNPINSTHYKLSVISEIPKVERQISVEQFQRFLAELPDFYRRIATVQFYSGARISEVAGIQWKNVDFDRRVLKIQEVLVWIFSRPVIKKMPKNGDSREVFINYSMMDIFKRQFGDRSADSPFVFHRNGKPLLYTVICANYNRAWKKANLPQYRGCHIVRYAGAQLSRRLTGSIDGAKALTGHRSIQLANQYSEYSCIDQNRDVVEKLEAAMKPEKVCA